LKKFGHSATCYIVSQKIGSINEWDIEKGLPENPLMSEDEIKSTFKPRIAVPIGTGSML
jgi:hypothetical protein